MADGAGDADPEADGEVRARGARRALADELQQRGHPQRAEDQPDDAAEQADERAGADRGRDVEVGLRAVVGPRCGGVQRERSKAL